MRANDIYWEGFRPGADHKKLAIELRKHDPDGYYSFFSGCDWSIVNKDVYKILFENIKLKDATGEFIYDSYTKWQGWRPAPSMVERLLKNATNKKYLQKFLNDRRNQG